MPFGRLGLGLGFSAKGGGGAAAVAGAAATTLAIAPSTQIHVNTATMTLLGGSCSFTFSGSTASNPTQITVANVVGTILPGMEIAISGALQVYFGEGLRFLSQVSGTVGGAGVYVVTESIGANATNQATTASGARVVTSITDKAGLYTFTPLVTGCGPLVRTDARGIKFLQFSQQNQSAQAGYPLVCSAPTGIDTHHFAFFAAMRAPTSKPGVIAALGVKGVNGGPTLFACGYPGHLSAAPYIHTIRQFFYDTTAWTFVGANRNRMIFHTGLQVASVSFCATLEPNLATTSTGSYVRMYHNGDVTHIDNISVTRLINNSGLSIGHSPTGSGSNEAALMGHVYELVGYWQDQLAAGATGAARPAAVATNADAVQAAMVANHAIIPLTKNIVLAGDSRIQHNECTTISMAGTLTDPGAAWQIPANYRVLNSGFSGLGTQAIYQAIVNPYSAMGSLAMYGSGNDRILCLYGANDLGPLSTGTRTWPTTNTAGATSDRADEVFNMKSGAYTLDSTWVGSISGTVMTVSGSIVGTVQPEQVVTYSGSPGGLFNGTATFTGITSPGTQGVDYQDSFVAAPSVAGGTPMAGVWSNRVKNVQTLLTMGYHVTQIIEPAYSNTATDAVANRLKDHDTNDLAGLVTPPGGLTFTTIDPRNISVASKFIFGADWTVLGTYYADGIHPNSTGTVVIVTGGDTPTYGLRTAALLT